MPEYWDICDENGIPTGRIHERGKPMRHGEYHMAVTVWILHKTGEFLISKRVPTAGHHPGFWEPTGGSALQGEDCLTAALREVREELGLILNPADSILFKRYNWPHADRQGMAHICTWVFRQDVSLSDIVLQPEETCDVRLASEDDIRDLIREGCFVPYTYLDELFVFCKNLYV